MLPNRYLSIFSLSIVQLSKRIASYLRRKSSFGFVIRSWWRRILIGGPNITPPLVTTIKAETT